MELWVSAEFEYSYKSLKSKCSLILFVYNLMIGYSKQNGANYPKNTGVKKEKCWRAKPGKGKRVAEAPPSFNLIRLPLGSLRSPTFFPTHANFFSLFPWPFYTTTSLWVVFSLSTLYFKTADWSLTTGIKQWQRNVVLGWVGVCGEGRNTSSPENTCVGD